MAQFSLRAPKQNAEARLTLNDRFDRNESTPAFSFYCQKVLNLTLFFQRYKASRLFLCADLFSRFLTCWKIDAI